MAKGYWVGRIDITNEEGFKPYAAANSAIFKKYCGRYIIRGGKFDAAEGNTRSRNVVVEFPDYASALACYRSPEYQENIKVRLPHSIVDLIRRNTYSTGLLMSTLYIVIFYLLIRYGLGGHLISGTDFAIGTIIGIVAIGAFLTVGPTVLFPGSCGLESTEATPIFRPV
jgi:uncharacterized protein (DUF1330 family)